MMRTCLSRGSASWETALEIGEIFGHRSDHARLEKPALRYRRTSVACDLVRVSVHIAFLRASAAGVSCKSIFTGEIASQSNMWWATARLRCCFARSPSLIMYKASCRWPEVMNDLTRSNHRRPQTLVYKLDCAADNLAAKDLVMKNSFGAVRTLNKKSFTVTSGPHHIGGENVNSLSTEHIPTAADRAILQGYKANERSAGCRR